MARYRLDEQELDVLYRGQARSLLAFFARRTYDAQLALDLVAETFARAIDNAASCRARDRDGGRDWLWGIARNVLRDALRRHGAERRLLSRLGIEPPELSQAERERVEDLAELETLRTAVRGALADLRPDQRAAVELRVVRELGYEEIAARLGISEQTARARVSRGLRAMGRALDGVDEAST